MYGLHHAWRIRGESRMKPASNARVRTPSNRQSWLPLWLPFLWRSVNVPKTASDAPNIRIDFLPMRRHQMAPPRQRKENNVLDELDWQSSFHLPLQDGMLARRVPDTG